MNKLITVIGIILISSYAMAYEDCGFYCPSGEIYSGGTWYNYEVHICESQEDADEQADLDQTTAYQALGRASSGASCPYSVGYFYDTCCYGTETSYKRYYSGGRVVINCFVYVENECDEQEETVNDTALMVMGLAGIMSAFIIWIAIIIAI